MSVPWTRIDGARMRMTRVRAGMSLASMARLLQVDETTIWRWEKGKTLPKPHNLRQFSILVGREMDDFILEWREEYKDE
jgi:transcriptional regulator with XRE-family HTH domain